MARPAGDPTERFFAQLASRAHEPLLRKADGVIRMEVVDGRRAGAVLEALSGKLRQWVECNLGGQRSDPILAVDGAWTCYVGEKGER